MTRANSIYVSTCFLKPGVTHLLFPSKKDGTRKRERRREREREGGEDVAYVVSAKGVY
jgi:hypothetical protein